MSTPSTPSTAIDSTLTTLQSLSLSILLSTQTHPIGFPVLSPSEPLSLPALLSPQELQVLTQYKKLHRVALERDLRKHSATPPSGGGGGGGERSQDTEEQEEEQRREQERLYEAVAKRKLKETVVEAVIATQPILRAIHGASTGRERQLLPLLHRRDTLSLTHANLSTLLDGVLEELTFTTSVLLTSRARNAELAAMVVEKGERRKKEREEAREGWSEQSRREWEKWEGVYKKKRRVWEVLRAVVTGMIVGSGVDWGRDAELRALVLECGDD